MSHEIYQRAAELIESLDGISKGAMAKDMRGQVTSYRSPEKRSLDLVGSLYAAAELLGVDIQKIPEVKDQLAEYAHLLGLKIPAPEGRALSDWNDRPETTTGQVVGLLSFGAWMQDADPATPTPSL